jgi:hypothetical protein
MPEEATPQEVVQVEPDVAITNLGNALDSIARNDMGYAEQKSEEAKPVDQGSKPTEAQAQETEPPTEETEQVESVGEDVQQEAEPLQEKAKVRWKELKEAEKQLKVAQKELSELKSRGELFEQQKQEVDFLKSQINQINEEREAINSELYLTRVQATKEWKEFVEKPVNQLIDDAEFFAKRHKAELGDFLDAIEADVAGDPSKLEDFISDWNEGDRLDAWQLSKNLRKINERKAELKQNSREAYEQSMQRERAEMEENQKQFIAQRETVIGEVLPKVSEKVFNILPEDKRPDINKLKSELMDYDSWPENLKVYGILGATVLPDLVEQIQTLQSQLKATKDANVKIRSSSPKAAGGVSPRSPAESNKPTDYSKVDTDSFVSDLVKRITV